MQRCVVRPEAVHAADAAVDEAEMHLALLRSRKRRGKEVTEAEMKTAEEGVAKAEAELAEAKTSLEDMRAELEAMVETCPEVECLL